MKILMLVNWAVKRCSNPPQNLQPPDYYSDQEPYWFFRYFDSKPDVTVIDASTFPMLEHFEHYVIRFYIVQAVRAVKELLTGDYDLIISHGAQSGIVLSLIRRLYNFKAKHILFDIGSFQSASTRGISLKAIQFASKSLDGLICHASGQLSYYQSYFPWLSEKARFIAFGADSSFFDRDSSKPLLKNYEQYAVCVGASKRDWDTLVAAYERSKIDVGLKLVGCPDNRYERIRGVECIPHVPVNRLIEIISGAEFCVLPLEEYQYSYGQMTLLQQMSLEKLVIAADVTGIRDYFQNGATALSYKPGDIEGLRRSLIVAHKDAPLRESIARAAKQSVRDVFNERRMANEIQEYCLEVLKWR